MKRTTTALITVALGSASALINPAYSASVTAGTPSFFLNNKGENDINVGIGSLLAIGDQSVVPNGTEGTTGTAQTTNLSTGTTDTIAVPFQGLTTSPNQFGTDIPYNANLLGPWTLTFANGANTSSVTTGSLVGATPVPFASNVTISGSSTNPTFSWSFPSNSVNAISIGIYDDSRLATGGGTDEVFGTALPGSATSFTVPTTLAGGLTLQQDTQYTIDIQGDSLRNPANAVSNANLLSVTQSFFNFTPFAAGGGSLAVYLPSVTPSGIYQFNLAVQAGTTYNIDPQVATGYLYHTGSGDPNFATVKLPDIGNLSPYDLYLWNGTSFVFDTTLAANTVFDFGNGGVNEFEVLGIDPTLGLDPNDTTAFITALTFENNGNFTGTMTPITTDVPEPGSLALLASGLLGFGLVRRRRRRDRA